jgi:hypothetical protein
LASHLLLISLAIAWLVQMLLIASNGSIKFVEYNQAVLLIEIGLVSLILLFGIVVFVVQLKRLGEKRKGDRSAETRKLFTATEESLKAHK